MSIICENCGGQYDDDANFCPHCGEANPGKKLPAELPKTIEELKEFCAAHGLPLEQMRFFIGEDCREPKAFGIFRNEDGRFTVYKNKADGSRAVRYHGYDEAYAVNEIVQKMKSEIALRRRNDGAADAGPASGSSPDRRSGCLKALGVCLAALAVLALLIVLFSRMPDKGYYYYDNCVWYNDYDNWYWYDEYADFWYPADHVDGELTGNYREYYTGSDYDSTFGASDFEAEARGYYPKSDNENDDWDDNDWDWGGGDWDSGSTDWDSDW